MIFHITAQFNNIMQDMNYKRYYELMENEYLRWKSLSSKILQIQSSEQIMNTNASNTYNICSQA
jgi:hypothetical protein